jgi:Domain of unknown function (DUF927)
MDSNNRRIKAEDSVINSYEAGEWKAVRLIDERTGNSYVGIDFPRRQRDPGFEIFDDDLIDQPKRIRDLLKKRGAVMAGTKEDQVKFIRRLLVKMSPDAVTLAMKPGMREKNGFVLGNRMFGSAKGRYRWKSQSENHSRGEIGDRCGDRDNWNRDVGEVALKSTPLTFGLCLSLACPLPSYVRANIGKRLLSETAVFNLSGESGSGKSSIVRAAAGLFGPPDLIGKWDFTRRGLEEYSESRNDLLESLDDLETHIEEASSLRTALGYVNQIVTSGQSKLMSKHAELPSLSWTTFGLTSSPESIDQIAEKIGWKRTNGQRARLTDLPLPTVATAGMFDRLKGDAMEKIEEGKRLIKRLDAGVTQNYGLVMPRWLRFLFSEEQSDLILKLTDSFLEDVLSNGDGFDERYARKFAVPAVAGQLAAQHGIFPWPERWPVVAVEKCYHLSLKTVRSDAGVADKKLRLIAMFAKNSDRFIFAKPGQSEPVGFDDSTLGLRTCYHGQKVLAIRDDALATFAGSAAVYNRIIEQFRAKKLLVGGQGHAGTTQLLIRIVFGDRTVSKPRFWIIDPKRLRDATS